MMLGGTGQPSTFEYVLGKVDDPSLAEVNFLLHADQVFVHARFRSAMDQGVVAPN